MKDTREVYWDWSWAFHHTAALCVVIQTVMTLSLAQRKELLGLARTQAPVVAGSYLESTLSHQHDNILVPSTVCRRWRDVEYTTMTLRDFVAEYQPIFLNPLFCSIIAHAVRVSPNTTPEEYDEVLRGSVHKEVSAAVSRFQGAHLDFRCIFSSELHMREIPFSDRMAPDPETASDTYSIFCRLRSSLSSMLILPSFGMKTVGSRVADSFWAAYYHAGSTFKHVADASNPDSVSCGDCLRLYAETGGYVDGPVEVRTAWKYNQIGPRVYYARGGSVLPVSQYLQPIVNRIIDAFPETHRKNRFSPPQDTLDPEDVEVIYDYSSFTSTLDHVIEFVRWLSIFFRGVTVVLIDVLEGPVERDLGELFAAYNQECNDYADFDAARVFPLLDADSHPVLQHTCGMLGVEGNIFLATLLHGIHLRFISGLRRSRCVGDDARLHHRTADGRLSSDERVCLGWTIRGIGDSNDDKFGIFESDVEPELQAYRYVKRPIRRDLDIMLEGLLIDIPSLIPLFRLQDRFHTLIPSVVHPCRQTFRSVLRLLRVLKLHSLTLESDEGFEALASHVHHLTREMRNQDPDGAFAPLARSGVRVGYGLPRVEDWGRVEYEDWVMGTLGYDEVVRFLKRGGSDEEGICDGRVGSEMIRETSAARSLMVKLGYLKKEELFDEVSLQLIGPDEMRVYIEGDYRAVCRFRVVQEIPAWYHLVPHAL
jgi:hypothetical protein